MNTISPRETRFNRFASKFEYINIKDYFNIKDNINEKIILSTNIKDNNLIFEINYLKFNNQLYNFEHLPIEICNEIRKFYKFDYIKICIKINYNEDYPFKHPNWNLIHVKHNLDLSINLENYYKEIVQYHNSLNKKNWSPAIDIHIDILDFIQKINHFDYMMDKNNFISYNTSTI
jgi:hypothetical protein